jgi:hypothetical protein
MTAAQFTPGPWGAEPCDGDWNITYGPQGEHVLARVFDHASEFQGEDAALIAAAPDMFDALLAALNSELPGAEFPTEQVEAALARARGEPAQA